MTAVPAPRAPDDTHWCPFCRECASCDGARAAIPRAWIPHITDTGWVRALCADCDGAAVLCPTLDAAQVRR